LQFNLAARASFFTAGPSGTRTLRLQLIRKVLALRFNLVRKIFL